MLSFPREAWISHTHDDRRKFANCLYRIRLIRHHSIDVLISPWVFIAISTNERDAILFFDVFVRAACDLAQRDPARHDTSRAMRGAQQIILIAQPHYDF